MAWSTSIPLFIADLDDFEADMIDISDEAPTPNPALTLALENERENSIENIDSDSYESLSSHELIEMEKKSNYDRKKPTYVDIAKNLIDENTRG
jgi:hypothetical protein